MPGALQRLVRQRAIARTASVPECDLCGDRVADGHAHLLDTRDGGLICACRACALLFDREAASEGRYRRVPGRRVRLPPVATGALGVPVGLVFFVVRVRGAVTAHYPSPAGTTESEIAAATWNRLVETSPELGGLKAEVEALLVNTVRDPHQHWIVPVDDCFRLVAVIRREWRGLSGGGTVWPEIERFFAELEQHGTGEGR